eukprot:CAMPEP_0175042572 /NCGR_PEP_ID=MMETSP0052_2-20121109/2654_1 /TAXON_ID=51329 ORGANISM="Polytomella parva, Strain SAG 63-3" /NCGR_SAMPLE_ID=MMETSP0052_2 /ASSEMBLY_ACC=CAM_ASM_000194 /LENGTH=477 /DNA_ID=CAMNT_0016305431 /DNA_START=294 /DNA_END=1724 /DNA_ORIENTATION=+
MGHDEGFDKKFVISDAHCHIHLETEKTGNIDSVNCGSLALMGTNEHDWAIVESFYIRFPNKVIPCFGIHPWFAHLFAGTASTPSTIFDLLPSEMTPSIIATLDSLYFPSPRLPSSLFLPPPSSSPSSSSFLSSSSSPPPFHTISSSWANELERLLCKYPNAIVGEIGLDFTAAALPYSLTSRMMVGENFSSDHAIDESKIDSSDSNSLVRSNFAGNTENNLTNAPSPSYSSIRLRTSPAHQEDLVRRQLALASRLNRPVSVHCVRAYGKLYDIFKSEFVLMSKDNKKYKEGMENPENPVVVLPFPPRIMLHAYAGSADMVRSFLKLEEGAGSKQNGKGESRAPDVAGVFYFSFNSTLAGRAGEEGRKARRKGDGEGEGEGVEEGKRKGEKSEENKAVRNEVSRSQSTATDDNESLELTPKCCASSNYCNDKFRKRIEEAIRAVPTDRILVESDLNDALKVEESLRACVKLVASAKGW